MSACPQLGLEVSYVLLSIYIVFVVLPLLYSWLSAKYHITTFVLKVSTITFAIIVILTTMRWLAIFPCIP